MQRCKIHEILVKTNVAKFYKIMVLTFYNFTCNMVWKKYYCLAKGVAYRVKRIERIDKEN